MTITNAILPMLAKPLPDKLVIKPDMVIAEEKFNGRRMLVRVQTSEIIATWSRTGKDSADKLLTQELKTAIRFLPDGVYDGELVHEEEGKKHFDVSNLSNTRKLKYVVFDVLEMRSVSTVNMPYKERRKLLEDEFPNVSPKLELAKVYTINSREDIELVSHAIWNRHGEGLMVKYLQSPYRPGKRSDAFMKVKMWQSAVLCIVGFKESEGEKNYRGRYARIVLHDEQGNECVVKTKDDEMCREAERAGEGLTPEDHPWLGRFYRIDYTSRTPDGKYENPVCDRFEDE